MRCLAILALLGVLLAPVPAAAQDRLSTKAEFEAIPLSRGG